MNATLKFIEENTFMSEESNKKWATKLIRDFAKIREKEERSKKRKSNRSTIGK